MPALLKLEAADEKAFAFHGLYKHDLPKRLLIWLIVDPQQTLRFLLRCTYRGLFRSKQSLRRDCPPRATAEGRGML